MNVNGGTSVISDLTDKEAVELRALCEAMLAGPVPLDHPLFVQWAAEVNPAHSTPAVMLTVAFLPRALHALLLRTEKGLCGAVAPSGSMLRGTVCARRKGHRGAHERQGVGLWVDD